MVAKIEKLVMVLTLPSAWHNRYAKHLRRVGRAKRPDGVPVFYGDRPTISLTEISSSGGKAHEPGANSDS